MSNHRIPSSSVVARPSGSALVALLALVVLALPACVGGADAPDEERAAYSEASPQTPEPCTLLDNALLSTRFDLTGAQVTRSPGGEHVAHPLCISRWPKSDVAEIQARQFAEIQSRMAAQMRGEDPGPMERTDNEVSLTILSERAGTPAAAHADLDEAIAMLTRGITSAVDGEDVIQFQYSTARVADVADGAVWVEGLSELLVVSGRQRFNVTVKADTDPAINRAHAVAFAQALARVLN